LWNSGRRCSLETAEQIAAVARRTQKRNAKAMASHRKTTLVELHVIGVYLGDCKRCYWPRK
jgi:hypothetical protein